MSFAGPSYVIDCGDCEVAHYVRTSAPFLDAERHEYYWGCDGESVSITKNSRGQAWVDDDYDVVDIKDGEAEYSPSEEDLMYLVYMNPIYSGNDKFSSPGETHRGQSVGGVRLDVPRRKYFPTLEKAKEVRSQKAYSADLSNSDYFIVEIDVRFRRSRVGRFEIVEGEIKND
jgi:hypothetical protein